MIHILLMILRIIGIVLLAVLGLLIALLLAILFIPVRYQAEGSYHGRPILSARITWLFRFLAFKACYSEEGFVCSINILGIRLWHNRDKDAARDLKDEVETILGDEERDLYEELQQDEENYRQVREAGQTSGHRPAGNADGRAGGAQDETGMESGHGSSENGNSRPGSVLNGAAREETGGGTRDDGDHGILARLRRLAVSIVHKIRNIPEKLRFPFARICDKLKGMREFTQEKRQWLEDEKNQVSLRFLVRQARRLMVHLWPRKGSCSVTFGFDDPYTTGQVLQAASLIYPFYHRQLSLYPVFDEKILDAEGRFKGRIRLCVILWLALRIFFDGHTRRMLRGFLK